MIRLASKTLHEIIQLVNSWKEDFHVNRSGDIVFQNKSTFANVRFTTNSLHEVQKHARHIEWLPETVESPDEIWMYWDNPEKQKSVCRNYIKFISGSAYIVQTIDGVIQDAFAVPKSKVDKFKKGVPV